MHAWIKCHCYAYAYIFTPFHWLNLNACCMTLHRPWYILHNNNIPNMYSTFILYVIRRMLYVISKNYLLSIWIQTYNNQYISYGMLCNTYVCTPSTLELCLCTAYISSQVYLIHPCVTAKMTLHNNLWLGLCIIICFSSPISCYHTRSKYASRFYIHLISLAWLRTILIPLNFCGYKKYMPNGS